MEVILLERIETLGQMGDVVNVKPGYARNYLLPQKKALRATEDNRREFEEKRVQLEADNLERRQDAEKVGAKLDGLSVTLIRQAGKRASSMGRSGPTTSPNASKRPASSSTGARCSFPIRSRPLACMRSGLTSIPRFR